MSDGAKRKIKAFERKLSELQSKIGNGENVDYKESDTEIGKEMEKLANDFRFTVWYEAEIMPGMDDDWDTTKWRVFIPKNPDKEAMRAGYLRAFMFGESEGNEEGVWFSSFSC
jgi:hypothetical protein